MTPPRQSDAGPPTFAPEIIEPRSWRLKGVGMYGSDVDVISREQYEELSHLYRTNMAILGAWANSSIRRRELLRKLHEHRERLGEGSPYMDDLWREVEEEMLR